ncbi:MAG: hypothetical protein HY858_03740 [Candidatus Solibacter usitatus]|nr:hypothetical protein [Candidatus Solibacter usitatus]
MTPVPIDLPLRPSEAAALAELILEHLAGRSLTDDIRNRLAGHASTLALATIRPFFGSLQPDPVHSDAYYLAVDALSGSTAEPLLLHFAPSTAPASALFPKPLLIGRMRPGGGREIIINAVRFSPDDAGSVEAYARRLAPAFLPRPHGLVPALQVELDHPQDAAPATFLAFRSVFKTTGHNVAAIGLPPTAAAFWRTVWAAIRSGFREGYTIGGAPGPESARLFTRFTLAHADLDAACAALRSTRGPAPFDLEVDLSSLDTSRALAAIESLKSSPHQIQSIRLAAGLADLPAACAAVNALGALPAVRAEDPSPELLAALRQATHGRLLFTAPLRTPGSSSVLALLAALR